jgi:hypothetical protein
LTSSAWQDTFGFSSNAPASLGLFLKKARWGCAAVLGKWLDVQASERTVFVVKSLHPIRSAVHLKPDFDLRVPSCPRRERM